MAKSTKEPVHLVSAEGTNYVYTKARRRGKTKLSIKKYDPIARKHVVFNEKKISRLAKKYKPGRASTLEASVEPKSDAKPAKAGKAAKLS